MTSIQPIEATTTLIPERKTPLEIATMIGVVLLVVLAPILVGAAGGNYWVRVLDFAVQDGKHWLTVGRAPKKSPGVGGGAFR